MAGFREQWKNLYPLLDHIVPAGSPDRPEIRRVERPYSPLADLERELQRDFGLQRELVYGPPGSGKTTELLALLPRLGHIHHVVRLDLYAYFEQRGDALALKRLQPWEVLAVVALAIYRFGEERLCHRWEPSENKALTEALDGLRFKEEHTPELNLSAMARDIALLVVEAAGNAVAPGLSLGLKVLAAAAGNVSKVLPLGMPHSETPLEQDNRVQVLKHAVTRLLLRLQQSYGRKVLLVMDGIDRGDEALAYRLFCESQLLTELPCHQVICAPQNTPITKVVGYSTRPICNIPVVDPAQPSKPGKGVDFFRALWRARAEAINLDPSWVNPEFIDRLAWASGGYFREFLKMMIDVTGLAWDDDGPVQPQHVEKVVDTWRRRWEEGMGTNRIEALRRIQRDRLQNGSELDLLLLEERRVVAFPNESIWYYPHPLLTLRMLKESNG